MVLFRSAAIKDFDFYYDLLCQKSFIYWGGHEKKPDNEKLFRHFEQLITGYEDRTFYIAEDNGEPVGYLQLTKNSEDEYEIGYGVSETQRGKGYGYAILEYAKETISSMDRNINLIGYVRKDNISSNKCFQRTGFETEDKYIERYFPMDGENKRMYLWRWNGLMRNV